MKESDIERKIREYAESKGIIFAKFTSPGWVKVPDRLLISLTGAVAFMELKKPGGDIHPKQIRVCAMLNGRNVPSCIVDNVESACSFIDSWLATQACPGLRGEDVTLELDLRIASSCGEDHF